MTAWPLKCLVACGLLAVFSVAFAEDTKDKAVKKDRELLNGTWRIVALVVNGNPASEEDARKLTVVNGPDNTWKLLSEEREIARGINAIDPTRSPKSIDIIPIEEGKERETNPGIYEISEKSRKLCFAPPGSPRPDAFTSSVDSQWILVTFERELPKSANPTPATTSSGK